MTDVNPIVSRVLEVMECLLHDAGGRPLGEIGESLGLPKSATHRMLQALCSKGWAEQSSQTGFYRPSLRLPLLAKRYLEATGLGDIVQPIIQRVAEETREYVRVAVVAGDGLSWLTSAQGATSGLVAQGGRGTLPLHAAAAGKAWLATMSNEEAGRIVLARGLGAANLELGPNAIRNLDQFLTELERTRRRGWGLNDEESEVGIVTVASAIRPAHLRSACVGTIGITGPSVRFTAKRARDIAAEVLVPAASLLASMWPDKLPLSWPPLAER
ncbi:MAG: IclR family transcriptional regulator [Hyphomicrobiales bacterium]